MNPATENIGRKEALLLLHLLDELPHDERASVDQMLAADAGLRAMYDQLRGVHESIGPGLGRLDAAEPMGSYELTAVSRRTARALSIRQVEQAARPVPVVHRRKWRPSAGTISTAAAVAILIGGLFVWWGNRVDPATLPQEVAMDGQADDGGPGDANDNGGDRGNGFRDGFARRIPWRATRPDPAAERMAEGLESAFDGQTFAANRGVSDAENQFDHLHDIGTVGRDDFSAIANQ